MRVLDDDGPARLLRRDDVQAILGALTIPNEETRLVGGCVRDALLGLASSDIDLTTTLEPKQTMALAAKAGFRAIPTGFDHGTVTVLVAGTPFEVTTLREDVETDGRHAIVRFGRDFRKDAERRDFTINALSLDMDGQVHDSVGGVPDLAEGRVRFIGDAATRIREDALRILRFFRFHARYGLGEPDAAGLSACVTAQDMIAGLSCERIRTELLKLLAAPGAVDACATMERVGILARLIAGPADLDRLTRLVVAMPQATDLERLAALAVSSKADAVRLQEALRLSKTATADLLAHASARAALMGLAQIDLVAMRALIAEHDAQSLILVLAGSEAREHPVIAEDASAFLRAVRAGEAPRPVFSLTGADLVARGLPPGPAVGRGLNAALTRWREIGCPDDAGAIEALIVFGLKVAQDQ